MNFIDQNGKKKVSPPWIANFQMLISHRSRIFQKKLGHPLNTQPFSFQNGMTLENWMKIEGAMSKNVKGWLFFNFLAKTLGGYFGGSKMDFNDSNPKA